MSPLLPPLPLPLSGPTQSRQPLLRLEPCTTVLLRMRAGRTLIRALPNSVSMPATSYHPAPFPFSSPSSSTVVSSCLTSSASSAAPAYPSSSSSFTSSSPFTSSSSSNVLSSASSSYASFTVFATPTSTAYSSDSITSTPAPTSTNTDGDDDNDSSAGPILAGHPHLCPSGALTPVHRVSAGRRRSAAGMIKLRPLDSAHAGLGEWDPPAPFTMHY